MDTKPIAELIHDRVFIEGGTLHVWLTGAKFRKMTTKRISRSYHDRTSEELLDIFETFTPSDELKCLMVRYADELRAYLKRSVDEWAAELASDTTPRPIGSSTGNAPRHSNLKGQNDGECHGGVLVGVSSPETISCDKKPGEGDQKRINHDA